MSSVEVNGTTSNLRHLSAMNAGRAAQELNEVFERLQYAGYQPIRSGDNIKALCPLHERDGEHSRSLNIDPSKDGKRVLYNCFGGCEGIFELMRKNEPLPRCEATLSATANLNSGRGLLCSWEISTPEDFHTWCWQDEEYELTENIYTYKDLDDNGEYVKVTIRSKGKRHSEFFGRWVKWTDDGKPCQLQRTKLDGTLPLYGTHHLPKVKPGEIVYAVEGEKDVDTLVGLGLKAISTKCFGGGNSGWSYVIGVLAGHNIVVIPDNDIDGIRQANRFISHLRDLPGVMVRQLPAFDGNGKRGYDVSDWFADGGTVQELAELAASASVIELTSMSANEQKPDIGEPTMSDNGQMTDAATEDYEAWRADQVEGIADKWELTLEGREIGGDRYRKRKSLGARGRIDTAELRGRPRVMPSIGVLTGGEHAGQGVFFSGMYNSIFGPGSRGKTWIVITCLAQELLAGNNAVFFTYELPWEEVDERLRINFGVPDEVIDERMHFFDDKTILGQDALDQVMKKSGGVAPTFVGMDSVREILSKGSGSYSDTEVSKLVLDEMATPFTRVGACVVSVDHTGHENLDRQAGSRAKELIVQGALYGVLEAGSIDFDDNRRGHTAFFLKKCNVSRLPWHKNDGAAFYLRADVKDGEDEPTVFTLSEEPLIRGIAAVARQASDRAAEETTAHDRRAAAVREFFAQEGNVGEVFIKTTLRDRLAEFTVGRSGMSSATWYREIPKLAEAGVLVETQAGYTLAGGAEDDRGSA